MEYTYRYEDFYVCSYGDNDMAELNVEIDLVRVNKAIRQTPTDPAWDEEWAATEVRIMHPAMDTLVLTPYQFMLIFPDADNGFFETAREAARENAE